MNEHQAAANYILGKMRTASLVGDESEAHSQAKLWLSQIIQGELHVQVVNSRDDTIAAMSGDGAGDETHETNGTANGTGTEATAEQQERQ